MLKEFETKIRKFYFFLPFPLNRITKDDVLFIVQLWKMIREDPPLEEIEKFCERSRASPKVKQFYFYIPVEVIKTYNEQYKHKGKLTSEEYEKLENRVTENFTYPQLCDTQ